MNLHQFNSFVSFTANDTLAFQEQNVLSRNRYCPPEFAVHSSDRAKCDWSTGLKVFLENFADESGDANDCGS